MKRTKNKKQLERYMNEVMARSDIQEIMDQITQDVLVFRQAGEINISWDEDKQDVVIEYVRPF